MKKNKNISESMAGGTQKKRSDAHFNVEKFIEETIGTFEDHFSFEEIQNFARVASEEAKLEFTDMQKHLTACEKCTTIYQDIVRFDPYLSNKEPIPEGFWESVWEILDTALPENIQTLIEESARELIRDVEGELDQKLFAHMADIEAKLIELIKGKPLERQQVVQIEKFFVRKIEDFIQEFSLNLNQKLTAFHKALVNLLPT